MNILITSGATREPIDEVRFLSNVSTGATGAALAENFAARGHVITLLRGEAAASSAIALENLETFSSANDLRARLQRLLAGGHIDIVIMAAAVADYRPVVSHAGKLSSEQEELSVRLIKNAKILPELKSFSPRPLRVVGFKLTVGADASAQRHAVAAQFAAGGVDAVVHNDLAAIRSAPAHPFWLFKSAALPPLELTGVAALADALTRSWSS